MWSAQMRSTLASFATLKTIKKGVVLVLELLVVGGSRRGAARLDAQDKIGQAQDWLAISWWTRWRHLLPPAWAIRP